MANETWIEEQKKNKLFRSGGRGNDADRMLEIGKVNKDANRDQSMRIITARHIADCLGLPCLTALADSVEVAQLIQDRQSRQEFMKVAIEQFQGKLQAAKTNLVQSLL